jgi:hypothetical protein
VYTLVGELVYQGILCLGYFIVVVVVVVVVVVYDTLVYIPLH